MYVPAIWGLALAQHLQIERIHQVTGQQKQTAEGCQETHQGQSLELCSNLGSSVALAVLESGGVG